MSSSPSLCTVCRANPVIAECGTCSQKVCKVCAQYTDPETFSFREKVTSDLTRGYYCAPCFDARVQPQLDAYATELEEAKGIFIFKLGNATPRTLIKKASTRISVSGIKDRDETYYRLGFRAKEKGFNAVVDTEVVRMTKRNMWEGRGVPALINADRQRHFED